MNKHLLIFTFTTHTEIMKVSNPQEWIDKFISDKNLLSIIVDNKIVYTKWNS